MRTEVFYPRPGMDGRSKRLLADLQAAKPGLFTGAEIIDVYLVNRAPGFTPDLAQYVFCDPVAQRAAIDTPARNICALPDWSVLVEVSYKAGVTNPMGITAKEAVEGALGAHLPKDALVQTATQYLFKTSGPLEDKDLLSLKAGLHNKLIEQAVVLTRSESQTGKTLPAEYPHIHDQTAPEAQIIPLTGLEDQALLTLSKQRLLALTLEEMKAIQGYYADPQTQAQRKLLGLPLEPTDVELEMIAQTWSEHCKHKIFAADIHYTDGQTGKSEKISSLYATYIKKTTKDLWKKRPFLRSVFSDNAGVVAFDQDTLVCFKVETHNSPSALDPYGGAITGIVGVNRDILGTGIGAKPIFNTNFLCFGAPDTPEAEIPEGLLHPRTVLKGVHKGIVDGGNHSGIPVVAGGFQFDESYKGKPLVFCGTGGILPAKIRGEDSYKKSIEKGDLAVMLGGRIGKDGIHGATFSSLALDEESPTSAVQIGDPITQKKMTDFLLEARDLGLYKGITDNGAGGISSSLGEMAESSGGIKIRLDLCPLKYQGLAPWEILVSESQERMSLAVAPEQKDAFLALAKRRDVEATVIGEFTDSGRVDIHYGQAAVGSLSMEFLHKGLPTLQLRAQWTPPARQETTVAPDLDLKLTLLKLLADPTIASKEALVRQYDHEVQGRSVIKPFCGEKMDGPSEGAVLKLKPHSNRGLTVTHGICPRYGDLDAYHMAMNAVDEAFRAHVALGGDPEEASVLDNFCWPDPVESAQTPDGAYKLAQLVRTCQGLQDACMAYGLPLISGKDSMKNDAVMYGKKVSIRPTLLVSLMGIIKDVAKATSTDFLRPGDMIYILGETRGELGGTSLEKILGTQLSGVPQVHPKRALALYESLHKAITRGDVASVHDLADGGLAVALAESCLGGRLGAHVTLDEFPGFPKHQLSDVQILFSETPSRFLVSVHPDKTHDFEKVLKHHGLAPIGVVTADPTLVVDSRGQRILKVEMTEMLGAFNTLNREVVHG